MAGKIHLHISYHSNSSDMKTNQIKSNQIHLFGRKQYIYLTEVSFDRCFIRPRRTDVAVGCFRTFPL